MKKTTIYSVWVENRGFRANYGTLKEAKTEARRLSKLVTGDAVKVYREVTTEVYRKEPTK